jgi:hypothetical protein
LLTDSGLGAALSQSRPSERLDDHLVNAGLGRRAGAQSGTPPFWQGAVLAHRFNRPLAIEMDDEEQSPSVTADKP